MLQQCLPLAVLKLDGIFGKGGGLFGLQQCLPLAVLKRELIIFRLACFFVGCNSAYRLRY